MKSTIDVRMIFEKDIGGKQEYTGSVDSNYAGDVDKRRTTIWYVFTLSYRRQ